MNNIHSSNIFIQPLRYEYAYLLSCSANHDEIRESIDLFRQLYEGGYQRSEVRAVGQFDGGEHAAHEAA